VRFAYPASFYLDAYRSYRATATAADAARQDPELESFAVLDQLPERKARVKLAIASKGADAIPFVLQMLRSSDREERDDARGVLALMGGDSRVVDSLISSIARATDSETVTALVVALGATESPRSIPCLARILAAPGLDAPMVQATVMSLVALTKRRFDQSDNPRAAAAHWLQLNGYMSVPFRSGPPASPPGGLVNIQLQTPQPDETREVIIEEISD
jgi:hypothetical protein